MWSRGEPNAHFQIDLKSVTLRPTHFAYRGDYGGGGNHPRSFELQGSNDGVSWTTLSKHSGEAWDEQHVAKDWPISTDGYYRIFRVQNLGEPNHLCCSGIELYGLVEARRRAASLALGVTGAQSGRVTKRPIGRTCAWPPGSRWAAAAVPRTRRPSTSPSRPPPSAWFTPPAR